MKFSKSKKYLKKIQQSRVYEVVNVTPLSSASYLSKEIKNNVFLKREDLQPVFSFKLRGAYNKISLLKKKGDVERVITASAGNHAQGVAYSARKLKLKIIGVENGMFLINETLGGKKHLNKALELSKSSEGPLIVKDNNQNNVGVVMQSDLLKAVIEGGDGE